MKENADPSPPDPVGLNFMRETVPHVQDLRIRAEEDSRVGLSGEKGGGVRVAISSCHSQRDKKCSRVVWEICDQRET